ncbi:MAG: hypothetical protein MRZ79_23920 [Bacteroidia bacterium]|nr:hypothetical protein [Bacteroidia bacterium]
MKHLPLYAFVLLVFCANGELLAQRIQVYSFKNQMLEVDQLRIYDQSKGEIRIEVGEELLKPEQLDSIKVNQLLIGVIPYPRNNQKNFAPLLAKYPGVWLYGKPKKGHELLSTKEALESDKLRYFSQPGGNVYRISPANIRLLYPNINREAKSRLFEGILLSNLGNTFKGMGFYSLIAPGAYVLLTSIFPSSFKFNEFFYLASIPTGCLLIGFSLDSIGQNKKRKGFRLIKE